MALQVVMADPTDSATKVSKAYLCCMGQRVDKTQQRASFEFVVYRSLEARKAKVHPLNVFSIDVMPSEFEKFIAVGPDLMASAWKLLLALDPKRLPVGLEIDPKAPKI